MSKLVINAHVSDHRMAPVDAVDRDVPPAPRWARIAAAAAALSAVPSGLWRVVFGFGVPLGFSGATAAEHQPGWGTVYCVALSALAEGLAFLTLGLVRPWGQVVPRWIPLIGGRRVRPMFAVVPTLLGALVLTGLGLFALFGGWARNLAEVDSPHGLGAVVMTLAYLPLVAWGPLLGAVTIDYARRTLWRRR